MVEIEGFPGYFVSKDGAVFSSHSNRYLKVHISNKAIKKPYLRVSLFDKNWKQHQVFIHRVLAKAFIKNPLNLPTVNHIDGDKFNNALSNLEWASHSDNHLHAFRTGLRPCPKGILHHGAKFTESQVLEVRKHLKDKKLSQYQIAKIYGVSRSAILNIHLGNAWKHLP